jgi:hypothetical protein
MIKCDAVALATAWVIRAGREGVEAIGSFVPLP